MNENKKLQERLFAELDRVERETTDKKILESINNIGKILKMKTGERLGFELRLTK